MEARVPNQKQTNLKPDIVHTIGTLDRVLSEMILLSKSRADEADRQTLKHHAEAMIGVGEKVLVVLRKSEKAICRCCENEYLVESESSTDRPNTCDRGMCNDR